MAEAVRTHKKKKHKVKPSVLGEAEANRLLEQCPVVPVGVPHIGEKETTHDQTNEEKIDETAPERSESSNAEDLIENAGNEGLDDTYTVESKIVENEAQSHETEVHDLNEKVLTTAAQNDTAASIQDEAAPTEADVRSFEPTVDSKVHSQISAETEIHVEMKVERPSFESTNDAVASNIANTLSDNLLAQSRVDNRTEPEDENIPGASASLDTLTKTVRFQNLSLNVENARAYSSRILGINPLATLDKSHYEMEEARKDKRVALPTETERTKESVAAVPRSLTNESEHSLSVELETDDTVDPLMDSYCEDHFSADDSGEVERTSFPPVEQPRLDATHARFIVANIPEMGIENSYSPRFCEEVNLHFDIFMRPFTKEQLMTLYYNPMLEHSEQYVDYFIEEAHQEHHLFYELVLNYHRARNKLSSVTKDIISLESDIKRHEEQVWAFPERTTKVQGLCADKANVYTTHTYKQAEFNQLACSNINQSLQRLQTLVYEDVAQQIYTGLFARLQVESYIYSLYQHCPYLRDIPFNAPVQALFPTDRPNEFTAQVILLKQCMSVLFIFLRKQNQDDDFRKDLELWLSRMAASLVRVSTYEDHMFLLQHLLRCPPGVTTWAASFIQVPEPSVSVTQFDFGGPLLDHAVAVLNALMTVVKSRSDFLLGLKTVLTPSKETNQVSWTLVDSEGEEGGEKLCLSLMAIEMSPPEADEDPANSWHFLSENDVVRLLDQIPLDVIFRHVLGVYSHTGQDVYNICRTTENGILKLCAFCTCVIELLGRGLQTYNLCRYRQLNKRIGRMIRQTVQYATDHWLNFQYFYLNLSNQSRERLQLEYDQLFLRATKELLSSQKLGSWQFLADLPFTSVSMATMWRLLWLMRHDVTDERADHVTPEMCLKMLEDADERTRFEESLTNLPMSEAIYLLTTFTNMARSRHPCDGHFVAAVTTQVFELAYLSPVTREMYCKVGRELLASVALEHPFVISLLLQLVRDNISSVGKMCLHLFRELPLYYWDPYEPDYDIIRHWLMDNDISSAESCLGRNILQHLNWDLRGSRPALEVRVHQRVAALLVEVTMKQIVEKNLVYAFTAGVRQVTNAIRSTPTDEQLLSNWAWDVAFSLRLHASKQPNASLFPNREWNDFPVLKMDSDDFCVPVKKALASNRMFAHYLALVMTNWGHDRAEFSHEGLPLLQGLATNGHTLACVHVMDNIVPLFYKHMEYLVVNERFQTIVHQLLVTDQSYSKMAKNLLYADAPPQHIVLFSAMLQHHLKRAGQIGEDAVRSVALFWLQLLTKLPKWNQDRNICFVLDRLCMATFISPAARLATENYFTSLYKSFLESQTSVVASMFSWIASGNTMPSLIERAAPECPYMMYMVLLSQTRYEDEVGLWPHLLQELLFDGSIPVESAVKKVSHKLKMSLTPIAPRLSIYRWMEQASETDAVCPITPLLWQQFFLRYLGRPRGASGHSSRGGVGERFFASRANISLMKSVRQKLEDASRRIGELEEGQKTSTADEYEMPLNYVKLLTGIYQTFGYWLDEPRLHDAALYLPALPNQYQGDKLALVFDNKKGLWLEYVDFDRIRHAIKTQVADWTGRMTSQTPRVNQKSVLEEVTPEAAAARILDRLRKRDAVLPPPNLIVIRPPVPDIDTSCLTDQKGILFSLHNDLTVISRYAKSFASQLAKFINLNANYIELLPRLHVNEQRQKSYRLECTSLYNVRHRCTGPADMIVKYNEHQPVEPMIRRCHENRSEFRQLMAAALMPPPENVCSAAVHVENTISALIGCYQNPPANQNVRSYVLSGQALFYHLVSLVNQETSLYIPTRQFFSSCIEILGQAFIMPDDSQCERLLDSILEHTDLSGLLAPNFAPNRAPQRFVGMYNRLCEAIETHGPVLIFMLLSKFDIPQWLATSPDLTMISMLFNALATGFRTCSTEPNEQMALVFGIFRTQFRVLCVHKFPENLFFAFGLLLEGTTSQQMSVQVWDDLISCLAIDAKPSAGAEYRHLMTISMVADLSVYLNDYFTRLRLSKKDYRSYGLYHVWHVAGGQYAQLCTWITDTHADKLLTSVHSAGLDVNQAVQLHWALTTSLFSPWLSPSLTQSHVTTPWTQADRAHAQVLVSAFVKVLASFHQNFCVPGIVRGNEPLSLIWRYYVTNLAVIGCPSHVIDLVQSELATLKWHHFSPDLPLVETMIKLYDHEDKNVFVFTSRVFARVAWSRLVKDYSLENGELASNLVVMVLQMLVRFATREEILKNETMLTIVAACEDVGWRLLTGEWYADTTSWFLEYCDPSCVLDERASNGARVLSLLKTAAEFSPDAVSEPGASDKHCSYVRLIVGLLCRCTHHEKMVAEKLALILNNILTEIETTVSGVEDKAFQERHAIALLCEVLALLNNCNPRSDITLTIVTSYRDWMTSSPESVVLLPSIGAACITVASVDVLADILYTTCLSLFAGKRDESIAVRWENIQQRVRVPELCRDDFIRRCLGEGYYLLLYVYMMQLAARTENEAELLLWLNRLLEMICHQLLDYGVKQSVTVTLAARLCQYLNALSEDKASIGLLGAIGLGRKSALSIRFRLIVRSLATFLQCQIVSSDKLRLAPSSPAAVRDPRRPSKRQPGHVYPSQLAVDALHALEALRTNKLYQPIRDHVSFASEFVANPLHSFKDCRLLLVRLVQALFSDVTYLKFIKESIPSSLPS